MRSEQPNYAGVVRALLIKGARLDVECTLGNGTDKEELTPLDLVKRCDAGEEIIDMLRLGPRDRADLKIPPPVVDFEEPVRIYALQETACHNCLNVRLPIFHSLPTTPHSSTLTNLLSPTANL